jgi:hypothetical protein
MWHITIEALQLKSDRKYMLGVNLKNVNIYSPMNNELIFLDTLITTIKQPKTQNYGSLLFI